MFNKTVLLGTLLLTGTAVAGQLPEEIIEQVDCTRVVAVLQADDIDASPYWQPADGDPPVGIAQAVRLLRDYAAARPDLEGATLAQISLRPMPHHAPRWHYLAVMHTHEARHPKAHYFVVLMNGQVYPAIEEPASVR